MQGTALRHFLTRRLRSSSVCRVFWRPRDCAWNPGLAERSHKCCVNPVGVAWNFLPHGRRCVDSSLEVGLRRPGSAVRRSGGPCVKVPVTTQVLHRSSPCEVGLRRSGSACSEFVTAGQALRCF
ncbi:hypothetical protein NDU88_010244 [Pleurodeles waltl]|uniref:Uncharacterized protein n=1 Tax=Pleurodeles waltl TaxID=8319 RepID=A0AAV7QWY2_PLEWA|nr:hypothetical protein NDU88_010244 [Pleurodeles waltl]